ncbi:peptide chain release factor N(5)-glutamine methyltransferase [Entomospira culicis]|uniref:Peptide chain release factor N(5)-glutamine methyltransferase n=1 Tax=Entomospira culicis TaxID=2719989 RepID=A0A968GEY6_9SPIO|nr:peptide chain release factor N(5)-glutamine methyltransferase [Entomospira culicis]NIZ18812.1 peptide chain release factor N(5)-glutamine methyltransferase [Entomospira culicis]NIZ69027.1 peptide chain release factor N(5)-glutamine methyltransferase [Entomospira culicis]WDI37617.1 peptide chain release factor N(5)-glutamine methyltransferase [Entomospira culicis]WDI39245.1 peptide chain release factor N(5)-glutamine methyltransferase [Entomospira culicis]
MFNKDDYVIGTLLESARLALAPISESPLLDAQLLLARSMGCSRTALLANDPHGLVSDAIYAQFQEFLEKRLAGYPVAYLLGYKEFYGRNFYVDERVLIPRPDTEILVEAVIQYAQTHAVQRIREVGFGSGAIALTLACELEHKMIIASDVSADAYAVFAKNHTNLKASLRSEVHFFVGNLWDDGGDADILVSNLPYLTRAETQERMELLWREPALALDGEVEVGDGGLGLIYQLIEQAKGRVQALFLEASSEQMPHLAQALRQANFPNIFIEKDLAGSARVIWAFLR